MCDCRLLSKTLLKVYGLHDIFEDIVCVCVYIYMKVMVNIHTYRCITPIYMKVMVNIYTYRCITSIYMKVMVNIYIYIPVLLNDKFIDIAVLLRYR